MKGRSEEDKEIADEVEQVDVAEADTDDDGFVSPSKREIQLALQKNELVDEEELEKVKPVEAYHGGMMSSCDGEMIALAEWMIQWYLAMMKYLVTQFQLVPLQKMCVTIFLLILAQMNMYSLPM